MALAGFVEFVLHLTRLNPEMINIARDCGHVTFNFFKFDLDDPNGKCSYPLDFHNWYGYWRNFFQEFSTDR